MSYQRLIEAFSIFEKYDHYKNVHASSGVLYAGPDPQKVTIDDMVQLGRLDWNPDDENGCFYSFT